MYFSNQAIFRAASAILLLAGTTSCAQDTMIRINSTSSVKLLPKIEVRYKACGESRDICQTVIESISSKQSELVKIANARYAEYRDSKAKVARAEQEQVLDRKILEKCAVSMSSYMQMKHDNSFADHQEFCRKSAMQEVNSSFVKPDRSSFNPTEEDRKKIIREVSSTNLNEYTFSKSDGSIVVICPTRYCAIASADAGWIGIGERGKPNQLEFLISN